MNSSPLLIKLRQCLARIIVLQGGGDAGKTVTILQELALKCTERRNIVVTVVSQTIPAAKSGALRSFQRYVLNDFSKYIVKYNDTERTYTFWNGSIIEFKSYQDEGDAKGSERDYLFINECNHISYAIFWQLERKTRAQIYLDYNPTNPFWVHDKLLPLTVDGKKNIGIENKYRGKVQQYIVDHRDNPFLTEEEHQAYEDIGDPEMFRVYSRGLTGKIKGLVFGHFKRYGDIYLPKDWSRYFYGIDYGYTNDPTAIQKVAVNGRKRVSKEFAYKSGISSEEIKNIIVYQSDYKPDQIIYSEADPNMINQLRLLGLNVMPAIKGPGSIAAGISKVKEHECYYTDDSLNFEKEISVYKWTEAEDIITGRTVMTNVPIDAWNHLCDAFRMGDYTDSFRHRSN